VSIEFQLNVVRPEGNARIGSALGYRDSASDIAHHLAIVEYGDGVGNGSLDVGRAGGPYSKYQTNCRYSCAKYCHTIHLAPLRHFSEKLRYFDFEKSQQGCAYFSSLVSWKRSSSKGKRGRPIIRLKFFKLLSPKTV
jgi:hypothetical protein